MSRYWRGMSLPWGVTIPSVIDPKDDYDVITSSIMTIVLTAFGERIMCPEFGSRAATLLFEPNRQEVIDEVRSSIEEALAIWDDRVTFVDFTANPNGNVLKCAITFKFNTDQFHDDIQTYEFDLDETVAT